MRGLSFFDSGEFYTVDVTLVQKVVQNITYTHIPAAPGVVVGIANLKGGIVTLLSLSILLGCDSNNSAVNAIVFKPLTDGNDQMGLLIDKPGELIDINENEILPPPVSANEKDNFYISGVIEYSGKICRIINVESIIDRFIQNEKISSTLNKEGTLHDEKHI